MGKVLVFIFSLFFAGSAMAENWKVIPQESKIEFKATQNHSPVTGGFPKFDAEINFSPEDLAGSNVKITVDLNEITASYDEASKTLKTADWFAVDVFPKAVFEAGSFTKTATNEYEAVGDLTIRDKKVPVKLKFTLDDYSAKAATAKGSTMLSRNAFGIGQGDWQKTDVVKDEVEVTFTIKATK